MAHFEHIEGQEQLTIFDILNEPVVINNHSEPEDFDSKIRMYVMAAIKNMGYEEYFDSETNEISIVSLNTSDTNKYLPQGCAMMHIYILGDKATTDLMIANRFANEKHSDWVECRNYDHRYYTKYYTGVMLHEERLQPNRYSLVQYRSFHFTYKRGNTWFKVNEKYVNEIIGNFYKWGF